MLKLSRLSVLVVVGLLTGCEKQQPAAVPTAPTVVSVSKPISKMVTESIEYTGYTAADKSIQLRSQVQGYLEKTLFKPRDRVKAGDPLFQIDPRPFQAQVDKAAADLLVAEAADQLAKAKLKRMEEALKANSISEVQVIEQRADAAGAAANIEKAKAVLEATRLDLAYTSITAPVPGLMGRDLPTKGDLIQTQQTLLSTITDDSVVYVYFNVSEYDVLRLRESRRDSGQAPTDKIPPVPVYIGLANETGCPHQGVLDYVAPQVDRETGTIEVRGRFENPDRGLLAGLFVRVRLPISDPKSALMVAERAIGMDQGQRYLLVVNSEDKVEYRHIKAGLLENGLRVVEEGLGENDRVIVIGLQRVRPGAKVAPQLVAMESVVGSIAAQPVKATQTAPK
jgi:membrane fusion protein, multidrug efflux system